MSRATLILNSNAVRARAIDWIRKAPEGTTITFKRSRRSLEQNALLWALLTDVSRQVIWYGARLSPEDFKDVFTASLRRARVVPGIDPGTYVPLGMRTSDMSKDEMSALIELILAFGAERGVVFNDQQTGSRSMIPTPADPRELGLETTAELRAMIVRSPHKDAPINRLLRDFDRQSAEIDRLAAALSEAREPEEVKLFIFLHALAIQEGYMPDPGESAYDLLQRAIMTGSPAASIAREAAAREEERERAATVAATVIEKRLPYSNDTRQLGIDIAAAIRSKP